MAMEDSEDPSSRSFRPAQSGLGHAAGRGVRVPLAHLTLMAIDHALAAREFLGAGRKSFTCRGGTTGTVLVCGAPALQARMGELWFRCDGLCSRQCLSRVDLPSRVTMALGYVADMEPTDHSAAPGLHLRSHLHAQASGDRLDATPATTAGLIRPTWKGFLSLAVNYATIALNSLILFTKLVFSTVATTRSSGRIVHVRAPVPMKGKEFEPKARQLRRQNERDNQEKSKEGKGRASI